MEHIDAKKTYLFVFAALIALTVTTAAVAYVDLGPFSVVVALAIAVGKMLLVALYFMHVRHSEHVVWVYVAAGFLWLAILVDLTMSDYITRGFAWWLGYSR